MGSNSAFLRVIFLLLSTSPTQVMSEQTPLRIALFLDKKEFGDTVYPAFSVAFQKVKAALNNSLQNRVIDTNGSGTILTRGFFHLEKNWRPHLYIGEKDSEQCRALATLASSKRRLYISLGGNVEQFALDRDSFPTFATSGRGTHSIASLVVNVMKRFQWTRAAVINALPTQYTLYAQFITREMHAAGLKYISYTHAESNLTLNDFALRKNSVNIMFQYLKKRANFFVLLMHNKESQLVLNYAAEMGMMNGDYAFLVHGLVENLGTQIPDYKGFEGVLTIDRPLSTDTPVWRDFDRKIREKAPKSNEPEQSKAAETDKDSPSRNMRMKYAGLMDDAMMMWLKVLQNLASARKTAGGTVDMDVIARDGLRLAALLRKVRMHGVTGLITFRNGLRLANNSLSIIQDGTYKEMLRYDPDAESFTDLHPQDLTWPGGRKDPPVEQRCFGEECQGDYERMLIIICVSLLAVIIFIALLGFGFSMIWRHMHERKAIANWRIKWSEVQFLGDANFASHNSTDTPERKSLRASILPRSFTKTGLYKGRLISIKTIRRKSVDIFERSVYMELKQILYVKHDNVNPFVGVCVDAPNICVAMAYADKGSLQDVLMDPQFEIDWEFRMSLAMDIAKGMDYLHSTPVETHGHLTSANCVIDERWICKITDYGLKLFRCIDKLKRPLSDLMWMAPEILHKKDGDDERVYGTKSGDVYSFGIIISELLTSEIPYHDGLQLVNLEELLAKVKLALEPPFRPTLPTMEGRVATEWIELAKYCWQTSPHKRPTFKTVKATLLETNSGKFTNVLERMQMVLEESLERANAELTVEKRKTENILRHIVPRTVLQAISAGVEVEPQLIKSVTLCLCDTTGIYKATSELAADVVVSVLKSMYQQYDEIIGKYGAFELSTLGSKDTMLLAGGLPINSATDGQAICKMSLDLMNFIATFTHPYIETNVLQMRISIHTGPAYTSVTGKEIPQFSVHGEAVQMTMNLHAFTKAMTIRISSAARERLPANSGLQFMEAGLVTLEEGGSAMTYLITGKRQSTTRASDAARRKSGRGRPSTGARRRTTAAGGNKPPTTDKP